MIPSISRVEIREEVDDVDLVLVRVMSQRFLPAIDVFKLQLDILVPKV